MQEVIFVPVDPTTRQREMSALNQVEAACAFSTWHQGEIKLFHLQEPPPRMNHTATKVLSRRMELKKNTAKNFLKTMKTRCAERSVSLVYDIQKGAGAQAILEAAKEQKSSLIFMMSNAASSSVLERLGSVSAQILLHSTLPVVVTQPSLIHSETAEFSPPKTLLVPLKVGNFSEEERQHNERIVKYATKMAKRWLSDVKLLSVLEVPYIPAPELGALLFADDFAAEREDRERRARGSLEQLVRHGADQGVKVEFEVSQNRRGISEEIVARIDEHCWVCMATHHQSRALSALMGSVSLAMVKQSPNPVLFLPRSLTH